MTIRHPRLAAAIIAVPLSLIVGVGIGHAKDERYIATTWTGAWTAPRTSTVATCRSDGHQAVWVAVTGTALLDIIQVGSIDGDLFYAYGDGVPGIGHLRREAPWPGGHRTATSTAWRSSAASGS